ncbi:MULTISPECIES: LPXTG cell wall anchor domain-containing protein [Streptococcus]|uniref:LPXTG cell wall anchor domain-containing protein n=1 Tax=Streptococcus oralis TaxID=1303 RepID=A0AAW7WB92_STROR|nr:MULTISPECIES: LPXTG cell wall anchor domain-containing protein [Streptococcus]MDO6344777.1 LPXTG cell wall anchor domain-containing protein [Streptococcus oralis]MDO6348753.1 LPXTG cell wall anchor domain-containing protein [Streptococcus oralis]MDO6350763.1 LPXTG cell wall anchor domain-containing protein [Streptococcus oralis]OFP33852.1 cell wall anchor protein [Streptococcus sp. HMSC072D07]
MNKKQALATLALSTIALAQAGYVSADEVTPIDSSAPTTEVVTPTTPSASTETEAPAVQPTEPSVTPVDPTTPDTSSTADKPQGKDNAESLDGVSTDKPATPEQPATSDKPQGKDNAESLDGVPTDKPATPEQPATSDKPQGKDNAESLDGVPAEKPKTTDEANEQGKSQIGTTSTSTGQVVHDVTKEPVETNTGVAIVSTQNGNVVLSDGSVVAPEEVGGTVNEDQTISVTDKDGKLKTLPNTGTAESILGAIGAMLLTAVGYFYKKKMF